jgi:hypothetical protein
VPAPSERSPEVEPVELRIGTPAELAGALTRSTLADGRVVGWYGAPGRVIDAELADRPVPPALAAAYGTERFWERWTAAECAAKHFDVPIAVWLREHGLSAGGLRVEHRVLDPAPGHPPGRVLVAVASAASPV